MICPRCDGEFVDERFYGPCRDCRAELVRDLRSPAPWLGCFRRVKIDDWHDDLVPNLEALARRKLGRAHQRHRERRWQERAS